jgi:hypothetical protein
VSGSPAAGGLGDGTADGDLIEDKADDSVVGLQGDPLELSEDTEPDPLVAAVADRGGRAGRVGDRLVGAAKPQGLRHLVEASP